jgi:hypothetical protein
VGFVVLSWHLAGIFIVAITSTSLLTVWQTLPINAGVFKLDTLGRPGCDMNIKGELLVVAREGIEPPTRGFSMACCKII